MYIDNIIKKLTLFSSINQLKISKDNDSKIVEKKDRKTTKKGQI